MCCRWTRPFLERFGERSIIKMLCEMTLAATPAMMSMLPLITSMVEAPTCTRPSLIADAAPSDTIHYVGIGSNMLREKVEQRAERPIKLRSFEPAVIPGHRLAFNLRGFAPLEPAVASLEPCHDSVCHGSLCSMSAADYEQLWLSEGGGQAQPAYEEMVVMARPYGSSKMVRAIALRAREHARLPQDRCPSERYMSMLIRGATELGLDPAYIASELKARTIQDVPAHVKYFATHFLWWYHLCFRLRMCGPVHALSWLLWRAHVPSSTQCNVRRAVGNAVTMLLLAPGAAIGMLTRMVILAIGCQPPPLLMRMHGDVPGGLQVLNTSVL